MLARLTENQQGFVTRGDEPVGDAEDGADRRRRARCGGGLRWWWRRRRNEHQLVERPHRRGVVSAHDDDDDPAARRRGQSGVPRLLDGGRPNDPALATVAVDPALSFVKDDIASDKAQGITTRMPDDPRHNAHRLDAIQVEGSSAFVQDCFVDGRIAIGPNGAVLNDDVVTKRTEATLLRQPDGWKVSNVRFLEKSAEVSGCAA
jgi:hypothetical protein